MASPSPPGLPLTPLPFCFTGAWRTGGERAEQGQRQTNVPFHELQNHTDDFWAREKVFRYEGSSFAKEWALTSSNAPREEASEANEIQRDGLDS